MAEPPQVLEAGDRSLLVRFAERAGEEAWSRVWSLVEALEREPVPGVVHWQPASASVLVQFDPLRAEWSDLAAEIRRRCAETPAVSSSSTTSSVRVVEVPVAYGGEHGPDLADLARHCGMTAEEVVAAHASAMYRVDFFGFVAGFAYLSGLPAALATPRLATPRARVPPGSVAIGGTQTAVYPAATPGGWRLIGRSPRRPARFAAGAWTLYEPGDRVRFVPIPHPEFARLSEWP